MRHRAYRVRGKQLHRHDMSQYKEMAIASLECELRKQACESYGKKMGILSAS